METVKTKFPQQTTRWLVHGTLFSSLHALKLQAFICKLSAVCHLRLCVLHSSRSRSPAVSFWISSGDLDCGLPAAEVVISLGLRSVLKF